MEDVINNKTELYYGADGSIVETEDISFAKSVKYAAHHGKDGTLTQYFVKTCDGSLCNPVNFENQRRALAHKTKLIKTNELAFLLYIRFLRTRNNSNYIQAQRNIGG